MEFFRLGAEEKARFYQKILLEVGRLAPIMLIDADGNFIFASDAFLTDMGLEAEDLRHKSAYDLVAEKYYDRSPSLKALAEGKDCGELSESKDGFPVYTETKLLRNEQGEVEYALCHSLKPASIDHEVELLRHQVAYYRGEVAELKNRLRSGPQTIYQSEAMRRSIVTADRVAKADTAVMLTGESGVGKDLMARHIHERSARSGKPFVPVCIPMMSPSLLNSSAGETMALAKPVMGTSVPAPARLASLSKSPSPVSRAAAKMRVIDTALPASSAVSPAFLYRFSSPCPTVQISPPITNAHIKFFRMGEGLDLPLTYSPYSLLVISIKRFLLWLA